MQYGYDPGVYTFPTVKPIDKDVIENAARSFELIVTCEKHNIIGGFGSTVAEVLAQMCGNKASMMIGLRDSYCTQVGDQKYLRKQVGLDGKNIAERIKERLDYGKQREFRCE